MDTLNSAAAIAYNSGSFNGIAVLVIVLYAAFVITNLIATFKIIVKAGYSGWWFLIPLSPIIVSVIALIVLYAQAHSASSYYGTVNYSLTTIVGWWVVLGVCALLNWIFYLVFAFSDWPVRKRARLAGPPSPGFYQPMAPMPGPRPTSPAQPAPPRSPPSSSVAPTRPVVPTRPVSPTQPTPTPRPVAEVPSQPAPSQPAPTQTTTVTPPGPRVFCGRCGAASSSSGAFCGECGNSLAGK